MRVWRAAASRRAGGGGVAGRRGDFEGAGGGGFGLWQWDQPELFRGRGTVFDGGKPAPDGRRRATGNLQVASGTGHKVNPATRLFLRRCEQSETRPCCDGSHEGAGFQAAGVCGAGGWQSTRAVGTRTL